MPLPIDHLPTDSRSLGALVLKLQRQIQELRGARPVLADWTALPYGANWSNFGGTFGPGRYRKLVNGKVELDGLATCAVTPTAGMVIAQLPPGFRPPADVNAGRLASGTASTATIDVYIRAATGNIEVQNPGAGTFQWLSLASISFSTT